jgi:hypothetical protein
MKVILALPFLTIDPIIILGKKVTLILVFKNCLTISYFYDSI